MFFASHKSIFLILTSFFIFYLLQCPSVSADHSQTTDESPLLDNISEDGDEDFVDENSPKIKTKRWKLVCPNRKINKTIKSCNAKSCKACEGNKSQDWFPLAKERTNQKGEKILRNCHCKKPNLTCTLEDGRKFASKVDFSGKDEFSRSKCDTELCLKHCIFHAPTSMRLGKRILRKVFEFFGVKGKKQPALKLLWSASSTRYGPLRRGIQCSCQEMLPSTPDQDRNKAYEDFMATVEARNPLNYHSVMARIKLDPEEQQRHAQQAAQLQRLQLFKQHVDGLNMKPELKEKLLEAYEKEGSPAMWSQYKESLPFSAESIIERGWSLSHDFSSKWMNTQAECGNEWNFSVKAPS